MSKIIVAAAQTGPVLTDDLSAGVEEAGRLIVSAAERGANLIAFSELFLTPFFPNRLEANFERWFAELHDPRLKPIFKAAQHNNIAVVLPLAEKCGSSFYNSAALIGPDGEVIGVYRKVHIPAIFPSSAEGGTGSYEKFYFAPGAELPVFDVKGTRVGIQICYDRKFPEASQMLAAKGAQVVIMPICAATYGESSLREDTWELPLRARSYDSGVFVVAVNRAGDEHGRRHIGRSMIIDPVGAKIVCEAGPDRSELLTATLDLDHVRVAQTSLPWWRDRRNDLYKREQF